MLRAKVYQWSRLRVCHIPGSEKKRGSLQVKEPIRSKIHLSKTPHYMALYDKTEAKKIGNKITPGKLVYFL